VFCPSSDNCHLGVCDEQTHNCKNVVGNDGAQCDDMDPCTITGVCNAGVCAKGAPVNCTVFDSDCTVGYCDPALGCLSMPKNEGGVCGAFTTCSTGVCASGQCMPVPQNEGGNCDDGLFNPCTQGKCQNAMCISQPKNEGDPCDDQMFNPCTWGTCQSGFCI